MEMPPQPERRFVRKALPWAIAAAGLLIYLATLNRWLTLTSLSVAAEVNGWHWQPMLYQPLLFLLTWPLRWLPASWAPLALNLCDALWGSLTLALLARSVALLPQDRLEQQRLLVRNEKGLLSLPSAWVPPVFAAVALGLQLTFWENATAASGVMLQLLLFATVIWCLLEYRCDPRLCWLDRAALVSGIALANSWAMAGFLPLVAVALILSKRLRFFHVRFLKHVESSEWKKAIPNLASDLRFFLRMALFGLAGLSLILLLPLVQALSAESTIGFWPALLAVVGTSTSAVLLVARVFRYHREVALLLAAVSLLPVLLLSIRWRAMTGRKSNRRVDLVSFILYAAHALLLLICVCVAFDPPFSPRQLSRGIGLPLPLLPLHYLVALSIGYYSGFFLLIFSGYRGRRRRLMFVLRRMVPAAVYTLLGLTFAGLLWKNLPSIQVTNGHHLEQYARLMLDSLPPKGAVVCSYDSTHLALLRAALSREGLAGRYVPVDANALSAERYRAWLHRNYPGQWTEPAVEPTLALPGSPAPAPAADLDIGGVLGLMGRVAQSNLVCYLQPNFGHPIHEQFDLRPHGLVYEVKPYPLYSFNGPLLTAAELAENETLWKQVIETTVDPLARLVRETRQTPPDFVASVMQWARGIRPLPDSTKLLARWYSSALNGWGAALQRQEQWQAANSCFAKAMELNPDNLPARVNLQCNSNRLAGVELTLTQPQSQEDKFGNYRNWNQILVNDGPFDDPIYCFYLGQAYARGSLWRQAGQQLERVSALAPKAVYPRLVLGDLLNRCGVPDRALQIGAELRADPTLQPLSQQLQVELAFLEAGAWFVKTNQAKAEGILQALLDAHPGDPALLNRTKAAFTSFANYTNALRIADQQLQLAPDNIRLLMDKGLLCLLAGEFSNAIPAFARVLALTNSPSSRINRGLAYLQTHQWDAAEADYQELLRTSTNSYQPYYGLAEVARGRGDTNAAIRYYKEYLSKAPTNRSEFHAVTARLQSLTSRAP